MAKLDEGATAGEFLPQLVAEIPWGHHQIILDKITGFDAKPKAEFRAITAGNAGNID